VSANNYGAQVESQLKASVDVNKNVLAQGQQKVLEAAQVPAMYKEDLKEIVKAAIEGRYGENGSQATFQWIKEHNPDFDSNLYGKIQQLIESYRDEFKHSQNRMIDIRRSYETNLGYFWRGMWLRIAGFPKLALEDYKPIVTDSVNQIYRDGAEKGPMKLR